MNPEGLSYPHPKGLSI